MTDRNYGLDEFTPEEINAMTNIQFSLLILKGELAHVREVSRKEYIDSFDLISTCLALEMVIEALENRKPIASSEEKPEASS